MQGMLGIGAAILGSAHVIGVDIDADALQIAQDNCDQFEDLQVSHSRCRYGRASCHVIKTVATKQHVCSCQGVLLPCEMHTPLVFLSTALSSLP